MEREEEPWMEGWIQGSRLAPVRQKDGEGWRTRELWAFRVWGGRRRTNDLTANQRRQRGDGGGGGTRTRTSAKRRPLLIRPRASRLSLNERHAEIFSEAGRDPHALKSDQINSAFF